MPRDITSGVQTTRPGRPDAVREIGAVACVASNALTAADARELLDALGLTDVAPLARAALKFTRNTKEITA
jgi:hypothetical protein